MKGYEPAYEEYAERGGRLGRDEFDAVLPDAAARVDERIAHRRLEGLPADELDAYKAAVCAAADASADPALASWSAGKAAVTYADAKSRTETAAIDRALAGTERRILYGAWL